MKTKLLTILMFITSGSYACDFCNCYLELDPGYNKNRIGIRGSYRFATLEVPAVTSLRTMHGGHGSEDAPTKKLEQTFLGLELVARYYPISKLQLIATLPYQFNTISYDNREVSRNALSDLTLLAYYQVANTMPKDSIQTRHRLFAGLGVKLPTGKSSGASDIDVPMSHVLFSGTGSTDILVGVSYIGKRNKFGWNLDASYKINGESKNDYKFGNTFNIVPRLFYEIPVKSVKILPHVGGAYEKGDEDTYFDVDQHTTGGSVICVTGGADFYFGNFSFATDVKIPVNHDMPEEQPEDKYWIHASFNIHF